MLTNTGLGQGVDLDFFVFQGAVGANAYVVHFLCMQEKIRFDLTFSRIERLYRISPWTTQIPASYTTLPVHFGV